MILQVSSTASLGKPESFDIRFAQPTYSAWNSNTNLAF